MRRRIFKLWLAVVLALNLGLAYDAWSDREDIVRLRRIDVSRGAGVMLGQAEMAIDGIERTLTGLAEVMRLYPGAFARGDAEIHALLQRSRAATPLAANFIVVDAAGLLLHDGTVPQAPPLDLSDRDYFTVLRSDPSQRLYVDRPLVSRFNNSWFLPVSRPLHDAQGRFQGVVVAIVDPLRIEQMYRRMRPNAATSIALYHDGGVMIGSDPGDGVHVGRKADDTQPFQPENIGLRRGMAMFDSPFDGQRHLSAFQRSERLPLTATISHSAADMDAEWWNRAFPLLCFAIGGTLLATLAALFAWHQTKRRLQSDLRLEEALDEKEAATEALHMARRDALTGLPGRALFLDLAARLAHRSAAHGQQIAVLYVDLDGFKQINDRHGHGTGDEVLESAADVLRSALRETDIAGRLGGDEFAVVVSAAPAAIEGLVHTVAERIVDRMATVFDGISCSVGIALCGDCSDIACGLRRADQAMYDAKRGGKNRYALHTAGCDCTEARREFEPAD